MVLAPVLLRLYLDDDFLEPDRAPHLESIVDLTRWCLPQVFFYGMYVLVGQVLNARGRFGPMMWAPIANNVIVGRDARRLPAGLRRGHRGPDRGRAVVVARRCCSASARRSGSSPSVLVLVPYLRASGFTYRPRFDFRDPELRKTLSLGVWTVLFVVATQLAYMYVVKLASGGSAARRHRLHGLLQRPAADDGAALRSSPSRSRRRSCRASPRWPTTATCAPSAARSARPSAPRWRWCCRSPCCCRSWPATSPTGSSAGARPTRSSFAPTIALFGPALVPFTVHYLMLRGFYALEATRPGVLHPVRRRRSPTSSRPTCWSPSRPPVDTAPMLVVAYLLVLPRRLVISFMVLRRTLGELEGAQLVRFAVRMALVLAAAGCRRLGGGVGAVRPRRASRTRSSRSLAAARRAAWPVPRGARRGAGAAGPRGHQPGRHRRGAAAPGLRVPRVATGRAQDEVEDAPWEGR